MRNPLATYLEDHSSGAAAAIDLLESLREQHGGEPLGAFAADLVSDVRADRAVLESLIDRVAPGASKTVKEAVSRLAERVSRLKLGRAGGGELGVLESLETLSLGILGKRALWRALSEISDGDERLRGMDLPALIARAEDQHARVEARWRVAVREVLGTAVAGTPA
jgi:hypothetical protein